MATQKLQVGRAFPVSIYSDNVDIPFPQISASGTATVSNATQLEDSTANFVQGGINPGDIIYNTQTSEADIVTGINSPTVITLAGFSFGFTSGDDYKIYAGTGMMAKTNNYSKDRAKEVLKSVGTAVKKVVSRKK